MPDGQDRIFLNYRRDDSRHLAGRLHDRLKLRFGPDNVFFDVSGEGGIPIGLDYRTYIQEQVGQCDVLLAVIGQRWQSLLTERLGNNAPDFLRLEIEVALQREIPLIPILADGTKMPRAQDLPETIHALAYRHYAALRFEHFDEDCTRIIYGIGRTIEIHRTRLATAAAAVEPVPESPGIYKEAVVQEAGKGKAPASVKSADSAARDDALYQQAVAVVSKQGSKASISSVQRKLKVGYHHAASLLERMEREGVFSGVIQLGGQDIPEPPKEPAPDLDSLSWATGGTGTDKFGSWADLTLDGVTQRLRWIEPGSFMMGSPEDEEDRRKDEGPRHKVTLTKGFWLFDTPVIHALWEGVMGNNPSVFKGVDRPVERVSWDETQAFLGRINSRMPGLELTLPTEAQWEYACRAGTDGPNYLGGANRLAELAWYRENSGRETHPVKGKAPNDWGLYDMLGNVWEWCDDGRRAYDGAPVTDPAGSQQTGSSRALRGGSWNASARGVRAAGRVAVTPDDRDDNIGFRCARVR